MSNSSSTLESHAVERVVDVRSVPYSRYVPWTSKTELRRHLRAHGIVYELAGGVLGGKPVDPAMRSANGSPDYNRMAAADSYQEGSFAISASAQFSAFSASCASQDGSG